MKMNFLKEFHSSSTVPTARNKYDDLRDFVVKAEDVVEIRDFATFIQAIGKVHYLAANPQVKCGESSERCRFRVFYRGQTRLYGKSHNSEVPLAYRSEGSQDEINNRITESVARLKLLSPIADCGLSDAAIEGLMQQYGASSRWLDVVDNIWIALWFACHRAWSATDDAETKEAKKHDRRSQVSYVHYERRVSEQEPCGKRFAYIVLLGVEEELKLVSPGLYRSEKDELLNLRQALPSQFIRPHVQHGWLIRRKKDEDYVRDLKDKILGTIKIPLSIALSWLGSSKAFEVSSVFPPPCFDTGWRDLSFRDECAEGKRVFNQVICS